MSFFDKLFSGFRKKAPEVVFGRYLDTYKTTLQQEAWDNAQELFDEGKYLESYTAFFDYLKDLDVGNVSYQLIGKELYFTLFQGSVKVEGIANSKKLVAHSKIAYVRKMDAVLLDRLLRKNFQLKYSRFALDESDCLIIKFDTYTIDGAPYKLLNALKELSIQADKQDDLIKDEFDKIDLVRIAHTSILSEKEKEVKYDFIKQEIQKIAKPIIDNGQNVEHYLGGVGYHLLNTVYKLDYLVRPEGVMMETLERIHRSYFEENEQTILEKVEHARREFSDLLNRRKSDFYKEMYLTKSTFTITMPVGQDRISLLIEEELKKVDWYQENGYEETALAITGYIVGFCLFSYATPRVDKALFELYYYIMEAEYFRNLGFPVAFFKKNGIELRKKEVRKAIKAIVKDHEVYYKKLKPDTTVLDYSNKVAFAKSYLLMIQKLKLSTKS